jgi:hypothetical protein
MHTQTETDGYSLFISWTALILSLSVIKSNVLSEYIEVIYTHITEEDN